MEKKKQPSNDFESVITLMYQKQQQNQDLSTSNAVVETYFVSHASKRIIVLLFMEIKMKGKLISNKNNLYFLGII